MTRIRKGNNLLSKGHLQHTSALRPGALNETQASPGVVDNKAIFNSIRSRISSVTSDGDTGETSEDKHGVSSEAFCEDDRQVESAVTAKEWSAPGGRRHRPALSHERGDDEVELGRIHAGLAANELKEGRKSVKDPRAVPQRFREDPIRGALGDPVSNKAASNRSYSENVDPVSPGYYEPEASNRMSGQVSGVKREQGARDPTPEDSSIPSTSGLGVGGGPSRVSCVKRRKIECGADSSVDPPKQVNRGPWDEWGALRWYSDSGLSPHLKRPRTPHQARGVGATSGRMASKRPRPPDSSAPEKEDSLIQRSNEAKSLCLQSSSEKMRGLEPSGVASTGIFPRTDAGSIPCRNEEEREPSVEMCPLQNMKDPLVENQTNRDDPSKQPFGSLMHSLYLVFLGAGSRGLSVREAVNTMAKIGLPGLGEREESITQVRGQLESNPYFIEVEEGKFFLCSSLPIDQDREGPSPEKVGLKSSKDEPSCAKMGISGDEKMDVDSAGKAEEATMGNSVERPADNLQVYLHRRARSIMNGRTTRGTVKSTSSDRSFDSDKCDRDSDEDFEVKDDCSGYSSGATTISDNQMSGEEEKTSADHVPRLTRRRGATAGDTETVKKTGWRNLVESVTEEDKSSKGGKQCARTDGRRWQCPLRAGVGYSLCEHHLSKFRMKKAYAALKRRAMVEGFIPNEQRQQRTRSTPGLKPRDDTSRSDTTESDDEETEKIGYSTHLTSKGQRKPVKNRSIMSMYD